jgi:hypothetical protein
LTLCFGKAAARAHNSARHRTMKLIIVICRTYSVVLRTFTTLDVFL